jgi:regulator of replication initiation timing
MNKETKNPSIYEYLDEIESDLQALKAKYNRLLQENTMLKEENEKLNDMLDELECNA